MATLPKSQVPEKSGDHFKSWGVFFAETPKIPDHIENKLPKVNDQVEQLAGFVSNAMSFFQK